MFTAAVRDRLGQPATVPAAAQIDATATQLRSTLNSPHPDTALRLAGSLHTRATTDADKAAASAHTALTAAAPRRAAAHTADLPVEGMREAILQHWHQRCYLATIHAQLGLLQPLQAVTAAEAQQVTAAVQEGQPRRLVGTDGIPLVAVHGTAMTEVDRRLAAGRTGVVDPPPLQARNRLLRHQVLRSWGTRTDSPDQDRRRREWADAAGVPSTAADQPWHQIPGPDQSRLIAAWLDTHRNPPPQVIAGQPAPNPPFHAEQLGTGQEAAAAMFNHSLSSPVPVQAAVSRRVSAAMFPPGASPGRSAEPETAAAQAPQSAQHRPGPGTGR